MLSCSTLGTIHSGLSWFRDTMRFPKRTAKQNSYSNSPRHSNVSMLFSRIRDTRPAGTFPVIPSRGLTTDSTVAATMGSARMFAVRDNLAECLSALRAHKLRASLTMLGLTMGVASLITVMTIVQGANVYVEQKIANLGTNVFQIARTPFAVTDFNIIVKALKYRKIEMDDADAIAEKCVSCEEVGASASINNVRVRYGDKEAVDVTLLGHTANMT